MENKVIYSNQNGMLKNETKKKLGKVDISVIIVVNDCIVMLLFYHCFLLFPSEINSSSSIM